MPIRRSSFSLTSRRCPDSHHQPVTARRGQQQRPGAFIHEATIYGGGDDGGGCVNAGVLLTVKDALGGVVRGQRALDHIVLPGSRVADLLWKLTFAAVSATLTALEKEES